MENVKKALDSSPINECVITNLEDINTLNISKGVYIIEQLNGNPEDTFHQFIEHKSKCYVAMPKSNTPSKVLYVGSSQSNMKQRLQQHVGLGYKKTYALHLRDWFNGEVKITVKAYDVENEVLQLIEDALAFDLQPAFGKRGTNNK